jgi:uncharacterized protein YukE
MAGKRMTLHEFRVALDDLRGAAIEMRNRKNTVMGYMDGVRDCFNAFEDEWQTPSEVTFHDVRLWFDKSYQDLDAILEDIIGRMWKAYYNYHDAELNNFLNLSSRNGNRGDGSHKTHSEAAVIGPERSHHEGGTAQRRLAEVMAPDSAAKNDAKALLAVVLEPDAGKD